MANSITLGQLSRLLGGTLFGDAEQIVVGVSSLKEATDRHLSFFTNERYKSDLAETKAAAVLVAPGVAFSGSRIVCADPRSAFAQTLQYFHPVPWPQPFVSPNAHIATSAVLGEGVHVEAFVWIGENAVVGANSWLQSGVRIGTAAKVGKDCLLMANSVVASRCEIGDRVWLNPGAVIGGQGFGFVPNHENTKIPQTGIAVLEDDVEVGSNSCVDRATFGETRVGEKSKLDNFVQIAHGASLGQRSLLVAYAALAGSAKVGKRVMMAGRSSVLGHTKLGDNSQLGVLTVVNSDRRGRLSGFPAIEHSKWLRAANAIKCLPDVLRRIRRLEKANQD